MVEVRVSGKVISLDWAQFEHWVQNGRIDPYAEIRFAPVTGDEFVRAWDLESFRSLYHVSEINFRRTFNLNRMPLITILIVLCNLALWHFMESAGGSQDVRVQILYGAKINTRIYELGEFWRLLSANFLHAGFWHLFVNMFVFFNVGGALENAFSRINYLLILFVSGLLASSASFLLNPSVSVGASGMVFGVMGGAMVFGFKYRELLPRAYRRYFGWAVAPYLGFCFWLGLSNRGIDNYAHLGGLIGGCVVALLLPAALLDEEDGSRWPPLLRKILPLAAVVLLLFLGGRVSTQYLPRLAKVMDDDVGIRFDAPDSWGPAPEFWRFTARGNGEEWISAGVLSLDRPRDLDQATAYFREEYLGALLSHGEVHGLEERGETELQINGATWRRLGLEWTYRISRQRVDAHLRPVGDRLYVLFTGADSLAYEDYRPLFERLAHTARLAPLEAEGAAPARAGLGEN